MSYKGTYTIIAGSNWNGGDDLLVKGAKIAIADYAAPLKNWPVEVMQQTGIKHGLLSPGDADVQVLGHLAQAPGAVGLVGRLDYLVKGTLQARYMVFARESGKTPTDKRRLSFSIIKAHVSDDLGGEWDGDED